MGQLADLGGVVRAAFALVRGVVPVVPHEVVGDELATPLERFGQGRLAVRAGQRRLGGHLDHGQAAAGRGDGVALVGVRLLPDPQLVYLGLEPRPVYGRGRGSPEVPSVVSCACAASASRLIACSRWSHCAASSAMARAAWSRRSVWIW